MTVFIISYFDSRGIVCDIVMIAALNKVCILFAGYSRVVMVIVVTTVYTASLLLFYY